MWRNAPPASLATREVELTRLDGHRRHVSDEPTTPRRTIADHAAVLGISEGAVRSRIARGTVPVIRENGRVWVLVGTDDTC
jgi:hypothetical protein